MKHLHAKNNEVGNLKPVSSCAIQQSEREMHYVRLKLVVATVSPKNLFIFCRSVAGPRFFVTACLIGVALGS